jgi:hypothetical protein
MSAAASDTAGAADTSLLLAAPAVAAVGMPVAAAMSAAAVAGSRGAVRLRDSRSEAARCLAAGELHQSTQPLTSSVDLVWLAQHSNCVPEGLSAML